MRDDRSSGLPEKRPTESLDSLAVRVFSSHGRVRNSCGNLTGQQALKLKPFSAVFQRQLSDATRLARISSSRQLDLFILMLLADLRNPQARSHTAEQMEEPVNVAFPPPQKKRSPSAGPTEDDQKTVRRELLEMNLRSFEHTRTQSERAHISND